MSREKNEPGILLMKTSRHWHRTTEWHSFVSVVAIMTVDKKKKNRWGNKFQVWYCIFFTWVLSVSMRFKCIRLFQANLWFFRIKKNNVFANDKHPTLNVFTLIYELKNSIDTIKGCVWKCLTYQFDFFWIQLNAIEKNWYFNKKMTKSTRITFFFLYCVLADVFPLA